MDRFYHFNRCAALMRRGSISVKTICSNVGDLQRKLFLILAFSVAVLSTYANDILPKEGASLNFILVGFDVKEANKDFVATELEIAIGSFNAADDFLKAKSITKKGAKSDYLVELPQFGVPYTWRMKFRNAKGQISYTSLNHFSVLELPPSFDEHRMNVTVHANKYQEAYVFYDGTKALYNMQGKVVWFMPKIGDFNPEKEGVRDLKETSDGTISFLGNGVPMEIGFCGNLIWKAPKNDSADRNGEGNFHHQFQKLKNGHYMTMGTEYRFWRLCRVGECNKASLLDDRTEFGNESNIIKAPFTTLVEYDSLGNVVWKWNSLDYVLNSDIYYHPGENGFVDIDAHANSFSFDRNRKRIYVSFKNINRIVAVSYPEGTVVDDFGEHYSPSDGFEKSKLQFSDQHCVRASRSGNIILFNNNKKVIEEFPSVAEYVLPKDSKTKLKKIWEYECPSDISLQDELIIKNGRRGGEINELPDKSFFVANCSPFWNMFIVDRNKKLLWAAKVEKYDVAKQRWIPVDSYRSNILHRKLKISTLIFRGEGLGC